MQALWRALAGAAALGLAAVAVPAAATELITNGNFETGDLTGWSADPEPSCYGCVTDGVQANGAYAWDNIPANPTGGGFVAYEGVNRSAYSSTAMMTQVFTVPVGATHLTLSFDWAANGAGCCNFGSYGSLSRQDAWSHVLRVDVTIPDLSQHAPANPTLDNRDVVRNLLFDPPSLTDGSPIAWRSESYDLSGLAPGDYALRFGIREVQALAFDNVSIQASSGAPEPAAWALMILGFGGAGAQLRRRRVAA